MGVNVDTMFGLSSSLESNDNFINFKVSIYIIPKIVLTDTKPSSYETVDN
jgi:hypothetical protein